MRKTRQRASYSFGWLYQSGCWPFVGRFFTGLAALLGLPLPSLTSVPPLRSVWPFRRLEIAAMTAGTVVMAMRQTSCHVCALSITRPCGLGSHLRDDEIRLNVHVGHALHAF